MSTSAQIASPLQSFAETELAKVINFTNIKKTEDGGMTQAVKFLAAPPAKIAVAAFAALETIVRIFTLPVAGLLQFCMGKKISEITAPVRSAAATILNAALSIGTIEAKETPRPIEPEISDKESIFKRAYEGVKNKASAGVTFAFEHKVATGLLAAGATLLVVGYIYWPTQGGSKSLAQNFCDATGMTSCNIENSTEAVKKAAGGLDCQQIETLVQTGGFSTALSNIFKGALDNCPKSGTDPVNSLTDWAWTAAKATGIVALIGGTLTLIWKQTNGCKACKPVIGDQIPREDNESDIDYSTRCMMYLLGLLNQLDEDELVEDNLNLSGMQVWVKENLGQDTNSDAEALDYLLEQELTDDQRNDEAFLASSAEFARKLCNQNRE